ncbi:MAG: signal peptide peptidase SppA [Thermodesulfobacteriota bacterium]
MKKINLVLLVFFLISLTGCMPRINLMPGGAWDPLQETTLKKGSDEKILVITVNGLISDNPDKGLLKSKHGLLHEIKSKLDKASVDPGVKAVILKIDSPGGSGHVSDIIYNEILKFKQRTGIKVVSLFMGLAASGAYYIALPSDYIVAHPTTVTGSIGAVTVNLKAHSLLNKIGVDVEVVKSGKNKDIGSPFRESADEEKEIIQEIIDSLAGRFLHLVFKHRNITEENKPVIASARIFTAEKALDLNLVDQVGYFEDAYKVSKKLAGIKEDPSVVIYTRSVYPDDNIYNSLSASMMKNNLSPSELKKAFDIYDQGFYYLWTK